MSQLIDPRETITIQLPSYPNDTVTLYKRLLQCQNEELSIYHHDTRTCSDSFYDIGCRILKKLKHYMIKSWTFVDENDKSLEISDKTLDYLPAKDLALLEKNILKCYSDS